MISSGILINALILVGTAMSAIGWLFFRHPGVSPWSLWSFTRPTDYATPLGVFLHFGGFTIFLIGFALLYVY